MANSISQSSVQLLSAAVSDRGLSEKRPENEDSFLVQSESGLFAVADGVGGAQAGDVASQMAVEILGEAFRNFEAGGDVEERMRLAIEKGNEAIFGMSRELAQLSTMATTLVALHLDGNIATIGHVGDSRLYRLDTNGLLFRETQDHSFVEEEIRAGRLTPEQAEIHPNKNVISRALGAEEGVEIDLKTIMFETGTTFLACSDGVTRHIADEELRALLANGTDVEQICATIKDLCYERGAQDNLTAVVVRAGIGDAVSDDAPLLDIADDEVETVATARAAAGSSATQLPDALNTEDTFELELDDDLEETEEIVIPVDEASESIVEVEEEEESEVVVPESSLGAERDVRAYRVDEPTGDGLLSKLVSGLLWLVLGLLIGAFGYYFYNQYFGAAPTQDQPVDAELISFEQQRRLVDTDPASYLSSNAAKENKTPMDEYLVGRAYLLQKNYGAAKTAFENAKAGIATVPDRNRTVLENDINAGMAVVTSEEAQKSFEGTPAEAEDADTETPSEPKG